MKLKENIRTDVEKVIKTLPVTMLESGLLKSAAFDDIRVFLLKENASLQQDFMVSQQTNIVNQLLASDVAKTTVLMDQLAVFKRVADYRKGTFKVGVWQDYWFVAKDIAEVLGYKYYRRAIDRYVALSDVKLYPVMGCQHRVRKMLLINLNGLCTLAQINGSLPAWHFFQAVETCFKNKDKGLESERKVAIRLEKNGLRTEIVIPNGGGNLLVYGV